MKTTVIRDRAGVEAVAAAWQALETVAHGAILFQGLAWARAIFDYEARRGGSDFDPVIVCVHDGESLVAVLPLQRVRTHLDVSLVPLGDSFCQYADFLLAPDMAPREVLAGMVRAALEAAPADVISLHKVRADSAMMAGMPKTAITTAAGQGAPFVALADWADFDAYFKTLKAKTRKNMRNARNHLERAGELVHKVVLTPDETLAVVTRTMAGRTARLKAQGLTSRAFATGAFSDFCNSLAAGETGLELLAMSLVHEGQPIAEQWGFVHAGRYYAYVASRDFGQRDGSPGKLHLRDVIETCFARGLSTADLLVPVMPYKLTWARKVMAVTDFALPVTPKGLVIVHVWDRGLRPLAKRLVLAMPVGLRALVMRAAGRG